MLLQLAIRTEQAEGSARHKERNQERVLAVYVSEHHAFNYWYTTWVCLSVRLGTPTSTWQSPSTPLSWCSPFCHRSHMRSNSMGRHGGARMLTGMLIEMWCATGGEVPGALRSDSYSSSAYIQSNAIPIVFPVFMSKS